MCLKAKQQGSMLVVSIFVLLVMSLLGLTMLRINSTASDSMLQDVFGLRAFNAARSGLELQLAQAFPLSGTAICTANSTVNLNNLPGFERCTVSMACQQVSVNFANNNRTYYRFSSTGQCDAGDKIVSRTLSVDALQ